MYFLIKIKYNFERLPPVKEKEELTRSSTEIRRKKKRKKKGAHTNQNGTINSLRLHQGKNDEDMQPFLIE